MKKIIGLLFLFAFASSVNAEYLVSLKLYNDGELIGEPTIVVEADRNASVSVENTFKFGVLISQINEDTVEISSRYEVEGEYIAPSVVTKLRREASVSIGNKSFRVLVEKSDSMN